MRGIRISNLRTITSHSAFEDQELEVAKDLETHQVQEAIDAAANAIPAGEGVDAQDLKNFYNVLQAKSYEEAQQMVVELAESGQLTEGVVEAAYKTLEECHARGQEPQMANTLQAVAGLLMSALQQTMMSPALRLVEELAAMKPAENRALAEQRLRLEFGSDDGIVKEQFMQDMGQFFEQMDAQDKDFSNQVAEVWDTVSEEERAQISEMTELRRDARVQMDTILEIANAL